MNKFFILLLAGLMLVLVLVGGCAKRVGEVIPSTEPVVVVAEDHMREHEIISGESLSQIADNYYGDPERAAEIARKNGITDPDRIIPGSVLHLHFNDDEWAVAERRATALVAYNRGVDFFAQDRLAEAEKQFTLALKTAPDLASAQYNLALVNIKRGKNSKALAILEGLTSQRPESVDYRFAHGHALFQMGRYDDAAKEFKRLTDAHPNHKRGVFSLARSLQEAGDKSAAKKAWQQYLTLDSTSGWAKTARSNLKKLG